MRSILLLATMAASLAVAEWNGYQELHELEMPAAGIETLNIDAGAGSLVVTGLKGADRIAVTATVGVNDADESEARKVIARRMVLALESEGELATLEARFESGFMGIGSDGYIALEVSIPENMALNIDDGSGSMDVIDTGGDVRIDDGSGSIEVQNVANLWIDDGSGSIDVSGASGDVSIVDGSGSISVRHVGGSVTLDDGSGSIRVDDVERDLIIVDDGSGGLSFSDVRGTVDAET